MKAAELSEALAGFKLLCGTFDAYILANDGDASDVIHALLEVEPTHLHKLETAARTFALPILEGDPEFMEWIARWFAKYNGIEDEREAAWLPFMPTARLFVDDLLAALTLTEESE